MENVQLIPLTALGTWQNFTAFPIIPLHKTVASGTPENMIYTETRFSAFATVVINSRQHNRFTCFDSLTVSAPTYTAEKTAISISRVDYAIDILAPEFTLEANNFVMHARCNRKKHDEITEFSENGHSGRTTSVTVGKNPGRQVIIFDKREEFISKHKVEWPEIWNQNRKNQGLSLLAFNIPSASRTCRVELRAHKRHLKDTWGITSWSELDNMLGDRCPPEAAAAS